MNYNIVTVRNKWEESGFLTGTQNVKQQVELSLLAENALNALIKIDADGDWYIKEDIDTVSIVFLPLLRRTYGLINLNEDDSYNIKTIMNAKFLKMEGHKVNYNKLIELIFNDLETNDYKNHNDFFENMDRDYDVIMRVLKSYIKFYEP